MSRTFSRGVMVVTAAMLLAHAGHAQQEIEPLQEDANETLEAYIADLGLTDVLAAHLRQKLAASLDVAAHTSTSLSSCTGTRPRARSGTTTL